MQQLLSIDRWAIQNGHAAAARNYMRFAEEVSSNRIIRFDETGVAFRYKDYRLDSADRQQVMTLSVDEFIRRFLLHVLPKGFHRIRLYGLLAGATRKDHLDHVRDLLGVAREAVRDSL